MTVYYWSNFITASFTDIHTSKLVTSTAFNTGKQVTSKAFNTGKLVTSNTIDTGKAGDIKYYRHR